MPGTPLCSLFNDALSKEGPPHLPISMAGNYEEALEMCLIDEELRSVVSEAKSSGWAFVNEGTVEKPKVRRCGTGTKMGMGHKIQ